MNVTQAKFCCLGKPLSDFFLQEGVCSTACLYEWNCEEHHCQFYVTDNYGKRVAVWVAESSHGIIGPISCSTL
jgi:hypothetical protein